MGHIQHRHLLLCNCVLHQLQEAGFEIRIDICQWFVEEQREEEALVKSILDMIKMVGAEGRGLFFFDREVARLATTTHGEQG